MTSCNTSAPQTVYYGQIVGLVIRGRRQLQEIDLATMAARVGRSVSGWSRVETGDTAPTVVHLKKAARALGIEPAVLLRHADEIVDNLIAGGVSVENDRPRGAPVLTGSALLALLQAPGGLVLPETDRAPVEPQNAVR